MINFAGFIFCAIIIFFSGKKLSHYGEIIADITGMGKAWVGLILMASVTSLPELVVGISSSAIVESADLAVGNILGSCALNLGVLAIMDAFLPRSKSLLSSAANSHILPAAFGLILMAMAGMALTLPDEIVLLPTIGIFSFLFIIVYLFSVKVIYQYNKKSHIPDTGNQILLRHENISLKKAGLLYAIYGCIIIITALFLPQFAEKIAEQTGLGQTFVGTLFLAASTVLPEIAVTIAAIRSGAIDLAVGNLLGSNLFNIFILFIDDVFYTKGNLMKDASDFHIVSVFSVIIMTAIAIIGLIYKVKGKRFMLAYDALLIFVVYVLNMVILYHLSA